MDAAEDRHRLRATFTEAAELYDRMRPTYPPAAFDDLADFATLREGARVLEIGCGTGQATLPLAGRGYRITAVELGDGMAGVARRNLRRFSNVEVLTAAFEDWPLPEEPFDAIVSATAFHWIDPAVRITKSASALRPGGVLAIIGTHHVANGDNDLFAEVQRCYERWDPATPPGLRLQAADDIPIDTAELDSSALFDPVQTRRYTWSETYSSSAYRDLLLTYSGHRALEQPRQLGLLDCIAQLIDRDYSGRITKQYMTELQLARRRTTTPS